MKSSSTSQKNYRLIIFRLTELLSFINYISLKYQLEKQILYRNWPIYCVVVVKSTAHKPVTVE